MKELSDKILNSNFNKIIFNTKNTYDKFIFVKRQWVRYHPNKKNGGYHIFQIISNNMVDGRYTKYFKNIEWYLTKSNIIRFITKLYASNMNVPPFLWNSIPLIEINECNDKYLYKLFKLTIDDINVIEEFIK
jgi:hypothetical protein